jgi:hypothetical protein
MAGNPPRETDGRRAPGKEGRLPGALVLLLDAGLIAAPLLYVEGRWQEVPVLWDS